MPTLIAFNTSTTPTESGNNIKIYYGGTSPSDTSGKTAWYNTSTNRLYFYTDGAWRAIGVYQ